MNSSVKKTYSYDVTLYTQGAAAKVVELTLSHGNNKQRILEIGAGPGSILKALSAQNCTDITAVEIDPEFCIQLKKITPNVIPVDLNTPNWPHHLNNQKFDTIIAADVLEHLFDPLGTLKKMSEYLLPNGQIILSIPHVSHAGVMAAMWHEDFSYQKTGLLDETHLKFFGIKNMQKLVENAGLTINKAEFIQRPPEKTEFAEMWSRTPASVQTALLNNRFSQVYQVVVCLQKGTGGIDLITLPTPDCRLSMARKLAARYRRWKRSLFKKNIQ